MAETRFPKPLFGHRADALDVHECVLKHDHIYFNMFVLRILGLEIYMLGGKGGFIGLKAHRYREPHEARE